MTKQIKVGSISVNIPDYSNDVGQALDMLQNNYEEGNVQALFVVFATKDSIASAVVGNSMVLPFVAMAASTIAGNVLDNIEDSFNKQHEED
jgi:hypothetical protein